MSKEAENTLYLVTGAAGFSEGTICRQLIARGDKVRALALPGDPAIKYIPKECEIFEGDLGSLASMDQFFQVPEGTRTIVLHIASIVTVNPDFSQKVMEINVGGTRTIVDLVLADIMMPNMDGYELVRTLREYDHEVPVILLTAKTSFEDKREGFSTGIDDYMTKPVNYEELLWRIEALLRRAKIYTSRRITVGDVVLDEENCTVKRGEEEAITLPGKEFALLYKLLSYPDQIFTRDQLLEDIWGLDTSTEDSTVKTHINRLRNRFGDWKEFSIVTIRGLGYKGSVNGDGSD